MVIININGHEVSARPGMTVLEVALEAGIYIPTLCYDPDLKPHGGCRLCVVEIEKMRGLPTACTTLATDGMVICTETEAVKESRRLVINLLIADHPMDCLTCAKNQRCGLQTAAAYLGITERRFPWLKRELAIDDTNPFFRLDRNYCILCGRCTRTCDEVTGVNAIEIIDRGYQSRVSTFGDQPLKESICQSCGECVVRCPVASLMPNETTQPVTEVASTCPYCGVGCGIKLGLREGRIISVAGDRHNAASQGQLCVKGRYGIAPFIQHPERLTTPLIKKRGKLTQATWDEALDLVAKKLKSYRPDEVAVIASAKCTNEENYVIQKFSRAVLGTNNVDHCARLCHSPSVAGLTQTFGSGAMTNSIGDVKEAACIFSIGSNTTESHPIIGFEVKKAARNGAKLIVANPRRIKLVRYADIWLRQRLGTDVALLMGMMKVIIDEKLYDANFIKKRCENFNSLKESLCDFNLDEAEEITGVPAERIAEAARLYATSKPAALFYSMGITQHSHGTENVIATADLAMLTGNVGRPGSGVNPLRGQNNVQGACDMGALPNVYCGYQKVNEPAVKEKFEAAWGITLADSPGLAITEVFSAINQGKIRALYLVGENPLLSEPDAGHVRQALEKLDFFVAQDIFMSESATSADVILPAATFAEKDGTFTNTERRVQLIRRAVAPVGQSRADWWITSQIAQRMGSRGFDFKHPSQIMDEVARLTPSYGGISFERLEAGGLQWPCPTKDHPGTPILHTEKFTRGKGRFLPLEYRPSLELPDEEYPLMLTTGRSIFQYHTGTMSRKVTGLNALQGEEMVEINPQDAARLSIADGDRIKVTSRRGEVTARTRVTDVSPEGVIFMTFHFAESPTNLLTNPAVDPVAKIPELKVCAVRVEKVTKPTRQVKVAA